MICRQNTVAIRKQFLVEFTVKMETLCSRFYADISATGRHINMGSSGERLELGN